MANSAAATGYVKSLIECSLCLSTFQQPKCLPCIHTFCQDCLQKYVDQNETSDELPCPLCRHMFLIPSQGLSSLPNNFYIQDLIELERKSGTKSEESKLGVKCDLCLDENNLDSCPAALKFCTECIEHLCQSCATCHEKSKATKSHILILVLLSDRVEDPVRDVKNNESSGVIFEKKLIGELVIGGAEVEPEEPVNTVVSPIGIKMPQPTGVVTVRNPRGTLPPRNQPPFQPPAKRRAVSVENTVPDATVAHRDEPEPHLPQPRTPPIQQQQPQQRVMWRGTLEWLDKSKPGEPAPRLSHSLHCQINVSPPDDRVVNLANCMNRMNMTLLPSVILKSFVELFKQSRIVHFQFNQQPQQNSEDLASLQRAMSRGYGGCINTIPVTNTQPSPNDVRVLLLLFSKRKNQFLGLIPNDPTLFVQGIKTVFHKHKQQFQQKRLQQHQMLGNQMPNAAGGSFTGP